MPRTPHTRRPRKSWQSQINFARAVLSHASIGNKAVTDEKTAGGENGNQTKRSSRAFHAL